MGYVDSNLIKEHFQIGSMRVKRANLKQFFKEFPINEGEKKTVQLVLKEKISTVLAYERKTRIAAQILAINTCIQ
ncbi:MAG: hypothetical protein WED07_02250 [Candidatus Freyarchaeum deiterrae]